MAGVIGGVVVLGLGGRLVMLASRLLHPEAAGRLTENGNRIGEFTLDGTIGLVLFGGLFGGLIAGVVWVLVRQWIPNNPIPVGVGAAAIGGFALIEADNPDFVILTGPAIDLVLLIFLLFLFGMFLQWIDRRLDRRLPSTRVGPTVVYSVIALLGIPAVALTFGNFFLKSQCFCMSPPVWTGVFLVIAGLSSLLWWVLDLRGAESPPKPLELVGRMAVVSAVVAGAVQVGTQIIEIV